MRVVLDIPPRTQLDNERIPHQSCSYTCMAMVALWLNPKLAEDGGYQQVEDDMSYLYEVRDQRRRGEPHNMAQFWNREYAKDTGREMVFNAYGSVEGIKAHIDAGSPVITHGYFTKSGHVILIVGYDDEAYGGLGAFVVMDPYGECDLTVPTYNGMPTKVGPHLYSYKRTSQLCVVEGTWWVHSFHEPSNDF